MSINVFKKYSLEIFLRTDNTPRTFLKTKQFFTNRDLCNNNKISMLRCKLFRVQLFGIEAVK